MKATEALIDSEQRICILAPTGRDATLSARVLADAGLQTQLCRDIEELCRDMFEGAGVAFLTGEALTPSALACLVGVLNQQPPWSDIPLVVLTSGGADTPDNADALTTLAAVGNVSLVERPVRVMTLLSSVKSALRARRRQYEVRDHLAAEKQGKFELAQSEQRLRIAMDAARLGAWQLNLKTMRLDCSPLCKANFGLPANAEVNYETLSQMIDVNDRPHLRIDLRNALDNHELYQTEYRVVWNDGSVHWLFATGRANYGADGEPYNMIGVTLDITDRKLAEEERERLLAKAQEANRLKDEFLATVSHELRTPLNAVLGWTHLLRSNNLDAAAQRRALETIERNARSQQQLIEDLLDVSRIITGKLRLDVRIVEPAAFIDAALEAVRPAAEAKEIKITKFTDPKVLAISGDPARLQQVIWNLLSNAIKFTPKGGRVDLQLRRVNGHVEITISDNGQGIAPEFLPFVFERFRQADMKTTRAYGGLGLGLAIVRQLVELHGGTVEVESPGQGKGAKFVVKLPVMPVQRTVPLTNRSSSLTHGTTPVLECSDNLAGVKVLVVDDEEDTTALLRSSLQQCGAQVITAQSANEAFSLLKQEKPDVLISDIGMPGEDGYELMQKVRSLAPSEGGKIPAVALTAYARGEDRLRALRSGYQMHLAKPVELAELVAIVASLVDRIR